MTKKYFLILIAVLLLINPVWGQTGNNPAKGTDKASKTTPFKHYTAEQFMNILSIRGNQFSFDESKILFSSNKTGIYNIYSIPVTGGKPEQLTFSEKESYLLIGGFPKDNRILFRADSGGNEISHIFIREIDGSVRDLTPDPKTRSGFIQWSKDDKGFYYESNLRDPRYIDVYYMDIETFTSHPIFKNEKGFAGFELSPDGRYLAMLLGEGNHKTDIYLLDQKTNSFKNISEGSGEVGNQISSFDMKSTKLYYTTDENNEFDYLRCYDLATGKTETVMKKNWSIVGIGFSENETYRAILVNEDGRDALELWNMKKNAPVVLQLKSGGNVTGPRFSKSEKYMTFFHEVAGSPVDFYVYDFAKNKCTLLIETLNPEINRNDLVDAKVIRYKSFDNLEIPAIFFVPKQASPENKVPAVVYVHGGPGGQSRVGYRDQTQYLVNHGYAVLAVNNRGSSGYGKTFFKLDDLKHGDDDLDDCVAAIKYLKSTGVIDENKIGIMGGSYGGYMVLAALAYRPQAFKLGVDEFGVANWLRTLTSIPSWWEAIRKSLYEELGNPEKDEAYLKRISPLFHADKIERPLMVLQGANDPRVLKVESDEIVEAVKKKGIPVEYLVFDDEGHGFVKNKNRIQANKAILEFLDKYLKEKTEKYVY